MIRVVIDTNVLVSALLHASSLPEAVINLAVSGNVQWVASEPILAEYAEVLRRPRLAIDSAKAADAMAKIRASISWVVPTVRIYAANDPADNMFLECAERGSRLHRHRQHQALPQNLAEDSHRDTEGIYRCLDVSAR